MSPETILIRFGIIFALSLIFGLERQLSHKPTGFGTFIFVAVGSSALGMVAMTIEPHNPMPLLGAIVTGIGFLGAGALIKTSDKIFGFTTAASIWIFAIIGLTVGVGEYLVAIVAYVFVWAIIIIDRFLEFRGIGSYQRKITINTKRIVPKEEILSVFGKRRWKLMNLQIDKGKKKGSFTYLFDGARSDIAVISDILKRKKWLDSFKIE